MRSAGVGLPMEKASLGLMAVAGIAGGFFAAWRGAGPGLVRLALAVAGLSAIAAPYSCGFPACLGTAVLTGFALGVATVSLAALLPAWCGVAWVGVGTGLGYAICNLPLVFSQTPSVQSWIAAGCALVGMVVVPARGEWSGRKTRRVFPVWAVVALFTALVWMDSAAFFIIQHSADLKAGTWGDALLWRNAAIHLGVACVAGLWLARGGARTLPGFAWVLLAVAALTVNEDATRGIAGWFYPAGVSLYSAALVAWPGWFSGVSGVRPAAWRAAWLFAIAGWFGSANGIGMAQSLERVPTDFVAGAGVLVIAVMVLSDTRQWRAALAVGGVAFVAWMFGGSRVTEVLSATERGRRVYISEGCIHCHSQYVRPGSPDEEIWGPASSAEEVLGGEPVLIGNRRHGPDLSNVGARRSEKWLKLHFLNPRSLTADSLMPSYAHLFEDGRGDDLVRYMKLRGVENMGKRMETAAAWKPAAQVRGRDGKALFATHCASCHGAAGDGQRSAGWGIRQAAGKPGEGAVHLDRCG